MKNEKLYRVIVGGGLGLVASTFAAGAVSCGGGDSSPSEAADTGFPQEGGDTYPWDSFALDTGKDAHFPEEGPSDSYVFEATTDSAVHTEAGDAEAGGDAGDADGDAGGGD